MNKVKLNERSLMVGDWVYYGTDRPNMEGDYDVVFEIRQITLDDFKFWADNDWDDSVFEEFIKPIDLSDEILGHNFPTSELLAWWRCEDKDKGYHIEYTPDGDFPSGDYGEFVECVKSVHELQHLMLAHGIEHKIEIENYMFTENTEL